MNAKKTRRSGLFHTGLSFRSHLAALHYASTAKKIIGPHHCGFQNTTEGRGLAHPAVKPKSLSCFHSCNSWTRESILYDTPRVSGPSAASLQYPDSDCLSGEPAEETSLLTCVTQLLKNKRVLKCVEYVEAIHRNSFFKNIFMSKGNMFFLGVQKLHFSFFCFSFNGRFFMNAKFIIATFIF